MEKLINLIYAPVQNWTDDNKAAFEELFGSPNGRFPSNAKSLVKVRAPKMSPGEGVSFAAYLHQSNPDSGVYGGMSFVIFPIEGKPALVAMGIGTQGLSPDETILSRPGHTRKIGAICDWLNSEFGEGKLIAWAKQDPTRIDIDIPNNIKNMFSDYQTIFTRYGKVLYAFFVPDNNREKTKLAVKAFLDLMFAERGFAPLTSQLIDSQKISDSYFDMILPSINDGEIETLLDNRRFVILEGPPGTGKTRLALELLKGKYKGNGASIQFHPNTTYENFIGGLSPIENQSGLGFSFKPKRGYLMEAVCKALENPNKQYLLHIDEINRADLAKVLGEAIFLFESNNLGDRKIKLAYDFNEPIGTNLELPNNLHIIGTMNSSDRSIAILDIAIRRRFAFVKLWPKYNIVQSQACPLMQDAFRNLLWIFIEYANDESLNLMPGHAYFLESDELKAKQQLKTSLLPLLYEYLAQGYISGFSEQILAYAQWLRSL
jgi:5-methylcytosine-specific restriction enzyme B